MTTKWTKTNVWSGKQIVWSIEGKNLCVVRDNREGRGDDNYPYRVEVDGRYHGDYRSLANAKRDALIIYQDEHKNDEVYPLYTS